MEVLEPFIHQRAAAGAQLFVGGNPCTIFVLERLANAEERDHESSRSQNHPRHARSQERSPACITRYVPSGTTGLNNTTNHFTLWKLYGRNPDRSASSRAFPWSSCFRARPKIVVPIPMTVP